MKLPAWTRSAVAGAAFVLAGALGYVYLYAAPRATLDKQLTAQRAINLQYETGVKERRRVSEALKGLAATTLGAKEDQVVARFRSMLNEIAEGAGMHGVQINTRKGIEMVNPAGSSRLSTPSGLRTALRKQKDFTVVEGDLDCEGTLEQALRVTAIVQAQPWVHRVSSFSIKPAGKERNRFALKLGIATILMPPDLAPKESAEPPKIESLNEAARLSWAGIVAKNMFKEPAPVAVAAAPSPPPSPGPPPPAAPPYNDWRLTGIIESRLGLEAMMVNTKSQERMSLPVGGAVAEAKFIAGAGERAVFEIAGQQFEIVTGQTLEQRRPAVR